MITVVPGHFVACCLEAELFLVVHGSYRSVESSSAGNNFIDCETFRQRTLLWGIAANFGAICNVFPNSALL